eukprot:jgi/Mesvir1/9669/Mv12154-RA.1
MAAMSCSSLASASVSRLSLSLGSLRVSEEARSSFHGERVLKASCPRSAAPAFLRLPQTACVLDAKVVPASHVGDAKPSVASASVPAAQPSLSLDSSTQPSKALADFQKSLGNRYTSEKSCIMVIGLSVHTAPVEIREKLAIPESEWPRAIEEMCSYPHIEEAGVLSTCNRMEVYCMGLSWHRGVREVTEWMSKTSGVPLDELRPHLFVLRDRDATEHIMHVSGGLDSLVLGEGQILAQVRQVYKVGEGVVGFGRNLTGLFKKAITAGKRVRAETNIAAGAVSVSSAAVELAILKLPNNTLQGVRVAIVGAGKMSRLLVKHLVSKNCTECVVLNRGKERFDELQAEFPDMRMTYQPMTKLLEVTEASDLIFTSTSSEEPLLTKSHIESMCAPRAEMGGVRRFIDISVPRNIASGVNELPTSVLYNVDDLREVVEANKEERKRRAKEAHHLLMEELQEFEAWRDSLETVPTIKRLRSKAETIRASELEKALSKMGDGELTKKQRKAVEELSKGLVNKLLHGPMQALRSDDGRSVGETIQNMHALERMFDLQPEFASPPPKAAATSSGSSKGKASSDDDEI